MVSPHALRYKPFGSSKEQQKLPEQEPKTASAALQAGVRRNRNNRGIFGDTRCPYDDNDDDDDDDNDDDDDDDDDHDDDDDDNDYNYGDYDDDGDDDFDVLTLAHFPAI